MTLNMLSAILRFINLVLGVVCLLVCWNAVRDGHWLFAFAEAMVAVYALYQSLPRISITMRMRTIPAVDEDEDAAAYRLLDGIAKAVTDTLPPDMKLYVLDGHEPRPVDNFVFWATRRMKDQRVVQTAIGDIEVSTVFLGIDLNYRFGHAPMLFETMIFGGEHDQNLIRSTTWDEAMKIHEDICAMLRGEQGTKP